MLRFIITWAIFALFMLGCDNGERWHSPGLDLTGFGQYDGYGTGGLMGLTIPFLSGEYWVITQGYGSNDPGYTGSHHDYGFLYGNDTYALDFTQAGCNAYGKSVTPMAGGTVLQVGIEDGAHDQGYGNNVLIDHGDGFVSRYAHLAEVFVSNGEELTDSDPLGTVGNTGYSFGTACRDHPGTHLHMAFYWKEEAARPEPLSGITAPDTWCWYNREGDENCEGNPGNYEPVGDTSGDGQDTGYDNNIDDEGELAITFMDTSPPDGTADETEFIWVATVSSPDSRPEATLYIENPNDGVTYSFDMETANHESPYVFTYRKTMNDSSIYDYWVKATNGDGNDTSPTETVQVHSSRGYEPELGSSYVSPNGGHADDTEFYWSTEIESDDRPEVWLRIVNPADANIYSFPMDVDDEGSDWSADYEKTLNDSAVYTFWMEARNYNTWNTGEVLSVEVN